MSFYVNRFLVLLFVALAFLSPALAQWANPEPKILVDVDGNALTVDPVDNSLVGVDFPHVGLYVEYNGVPCVFESTSLGTLPDIITGEPLNGVQLTPFENRVKSYDGEVFFREIIGHRSAKQLFDLETFIQAHHGKPYEQSNWELVNAEIDVMPWHLNKPDDSSLFCSETVALALREIGFMKVTEKPANEFTPSDFAGDVEMVDGYSFGPIIDLASSAQACSPVI